jgi:hypothetical protein
MTLRQIHQKDPDRKAGFLYNTVRPGREAHGQKRI